MQAQREQLRGCHLRCLWHWCGGCRGRRRPGLRLGCCSLGRRKRRLLVGAGAACAATTAAAAAFVACTVLIPCVRCRRTGRALQDLAATPHLRHPVPQLELASARSAPGLHSLRRLGGTAGLRCRAAARDALGVRICGCGGLDILQHLTPAPHLLHPSVKLAVRFPRLPRRARSLRRRLCIGGCVGKLAHFTAHATAARCGRIRTSVGRNGLLLLLPFPQRLDVRARLVPGNAGLQGGGGGDIGSGAAGHRLVLLAAVPAPAHHLCKVPSATPQY
mmetsp:Transcript_116293/g.323966  ORF Transcript_116293/g.323966 Transcript_116293/m.323966 type:complete len:275 (+) Transcript_116293:1487-2311(+)